jgi:hypothetical protein
MMTDVKQYVAYTYEDLLKLFQINEFDERHKFKYIIEDNERKYYCFSFLNGIGFFAVPYYLMKRMFRTHIGDTLITYIK